MLFIVCIYLIFKNNFNDAAALTNIYNSVNSSPDKLTWTYLYLYTVGNIFDSENIQFGLLVVNMFLITIISFIEKGEKLAFLISSSILINPLLTPLIGTITRSFSSILVLMIIIIIISNRYELNHSSKLKILLLAVIGFGVHPLEFALNSVRFLFTKFMEGARKYKTYIYLSLLMPVLIISYEYFGDYFFNKYQSYKNANISLFNYQKLIVFIGGLTCSIYFYVKYKHYLTKLNLIAWLSLTLFLGLPFFERYWMFPILLLSIIILNRFNAKVVLISSPLAAFIWQLI